MTPTKVLKRLVEVAPPVIAAYTRSPNRCVLATAIGINVLQRYGIDAEPLTVGVRLANRAFVQWTAEGSPGGLDEGIRRGAYLLTNLDDAPLRVQVPGRVWNRHLVILVPARECIVDLDMQQMNRPARNISVPPAAILPWPPGHREMTWRASDGSELYLQADPHDRRFEQASDWRIFPDIVATLERAIRKGRTMTGGGA